VPDHAELMRGFDEEVFKKGKQVYSQVCTACHGADGGPGTQANARVFNQDQFAFGTDPYSMYLTVTKGNGAMAGQLKDPEEAYAVVHYVREAFLKPNNPSQYVAVDDEYFAAGEWPAPGSAGEADDGKTGAALKAEPLTIPVEGVLISWSQAAQQVAADRRRIRQIGQELGGAAGRALVELADQQGNDRLIGRLLTHLRADEREAALTLLTAPGRNQSGLVFARLSSETLDHVFAALTAQPAPAQEGHQ